MRRGLQQHVGIALALALVATAGCKDKKKSAPAGERPATGAAASGEDGAPAADPQAKRARADALRKMQLAPISLTEVQPLIPTLPGTSPVGQPGVLTGGRQIKAVLCMASPSTQTAMTELVAQLGTLGFTGVETRPHPRADNMMTVHAEKDPYRVGATVQKTTTPDCPGAQGKVKIVLSYFKRVTMSPGGAAPPSP